MNLEARLHDGKMYFTVENAIPQIPQVIKNKDQGIGLENLRRRLNLLYPGMHSFETSKTSDSFIANLIIEW